jgi:DNA repair exonuclease SbcCD ATPase subunit
MENLPAERMSFALHLLAFGWLPIALLFWAKSVSDRQEQDAFKEAIKLLLSAHTATETRLEVADTSLGNLIRQLEKKMDVTNQSNQARLAALIAGHQAQEFALNKIKSEVATLRAGFESAEADTNAALEEFLASAEATLAGIQSATAELDAINPDPEPEPDPEPAL